MLFKNAKFKRIFNLNAVGILNFWWRKCRQLVLQIEILIWRSWEMNFWKFRGPFYDHIIFKDENNLWSNLELRIRDLNLTFVTFWILLAVKCPLKNYSKPYGYATAMPPAWGLKNDQRPKIFFSVIFHPRPKK